MRVISLRSFLCWSMASVLVVAFGGMAAAQGADPSLMSSVTGKTIKVPADMADIQAALNAAQDGDLVLVAPGTYHVELKFPAKKVTFASEYITTGDESLIEKTILDGQITENGQTREAEPVLSIPEGCDRGSKVVGFTIQNGDKGMVPEAKLDIVHNLFKGNGDQIDYEGGGGLCAYNRFENAGDDAVDLDGPCDVIIEHNVMLNCDDDGVEARLHEYSGPTLNVIIRNNFISGVGEDGIQFIDYPDVSPRVYRVENNYIVNSKMAGIGCMSEGNTRENYEAASIPEAIYLINNTIVGGEYGITGGDNVVAVNNIVTGVRQTGLKMIDGNSVLSHNIVWNCGTVNEGSNADAPLTVDPMLDAEQHLQAGSPAIDGGVAKIEKGGKVLVDLPQSAYAGSAPDIGAFESGMK